MFIAPVRTNTIGNNFKGNYENSIKGTYGGRGHDLKVDENALRLFNIENISSDKVGSKYIFTPKDPEFADLKILVKGNSVLEDKKSGERMIDLPRHSVSFTGKVYGSIGVREGKADETMKSAYTAFWDKGMLDKINKDYVSKEASKIKNDYNFFIPSDGDGTRYRDIATLLKTKDGKIPTKPASIIPATLNNEQMQLVQGVLVNFAKTGKVDDGHDFIPVKPAQGSAYAFLEGLKDGTISTEEPVVFSWGDNFSDIDMTKLILDYEKSNSGFTLLALPVDGSRIRSLGAAAVNNDEEKIVSKFKEKPSADEVEEFKIPGTKDSYLGVVGPYVLSKEVLTWIKDKYEENPESFLNPDGKGYDFSSMILGPLVDAMNNGEIKDENGEPLTMRVYQKPGKDTWSDLGAEKDLSKELKSDFATNYMNMPTEMRTSIMENRDGFGNIFFNENSRNKYSEFCEKAGVQFLNSIVYYDESKAA